MPVRWRDGRYVVTGSDAAAERNREYAAQFGISLESFHKLLSDPVRAVVIIAAIQQGKANNWTMADYQTILDQVLNIGPTPFDGDVDGNPD